MHRGGTCVANVGGREVKSKTLKSNLGINLCLKSNVQFAARIQKIIIGYLYC